MIPCLKDRIINIEKNNIGVKILASFFGSVIEVDYSKCIVYVRLIDELDTNCEEFQCEMELSIFPKDGFRDHIIFWMPVGEYLENNCSKTFSKIEYFYWTKEDIAIAEKDGDELFKKIKNFN